MKTIFLLIALIVSAFGNIEQYFLEASKNTTLILRCCTQ